jgi:hypothetical protein
MSASCHSASSTTAGGVSAAAATAAASAALPPPLRPLLRRFGIELLHALARRGQDARRALGPDAVDLGDLVLGGRGELVRGLEPALIEQLRRDVADPREWQ